MELGHLFLRIERLSPGLLTNNYYPFLLAVGSSTDNFVVGFAIGIKNEGDRLPVSFNLFISLANAIGAFLAGVMGNFTIEQLSMDDESTRQFSSMVAGIAFYYLALNEFLQANKIEDENDSAQSRKDLQRGKSPIRAALQLALPMTLNNLAGGIAGGAVGISPTISFIMAFICSFAMMLAGFEISKRFSNRWIEQHANVLSFVIFGFLANFQILDYLGIKWNIGFLSK
jgi:putative Mn2+ efflux pump MntP